MSVALFYIFSSLFDVWLNSDNWLVISAAFSLFPYIVLVEIYEDYAALHR